MRNVSSIFLRMLAVLLAYGGAAGPASSLMAADNSSDTAGYGDPADNVLVPAAREQTRQLSAARRAMQQGDPAEAAALLQQLLAADVPDGFTARPESTATCSTLKSEASQLLGAMPAAQRQWYELQFGAAAQRLLDGALQQRDLKALAELSATYFHTEAGGVATLLLAQHWLDCGHARRSLALLAELDEFHAAARRYQPELSVLESIGWICLGKRDRAQQVVDRLADTHPQAVVRLGDEQFSFARDTDLITGLLEDVSGTGVHRPVVVDDWRMLRGDPARNAGSSWRGVLGELSWVSESDDDGSAEESSSYLAYQPLDITGTVLARTPNGRVTAIDASTGKRIWEYPYKLASQLSAEPTQQRVVIRMSGAANTKQMRWKDAVSGQMSSDGRHLYLIDGLQAGNTASAAWPQIRAITGSATPANNRLLAVSLQREGALVWSIGGADGESEPELAGSFFLGPPVLFNGRLYVLAEIQGVVVLAALQPDSGRLIWSQTIAYPRAPITLDWSRRLAGAMPSLSDGVLVCSTSAGAVVAVDALTGRLMWGYRYPRPQDSAPQNAAILRAMMHQRADKSRWMDASPTIAGGRVLVTSADSEELLCLDLFTGKLEWAQDREAMLYVACVHDGRVVLVGEEKVTALSLDDGSSAWSTKSIEIPSDSKPSGRGVRSGRFYYVPTHNSEILKLDLTEGKLVERMKTPSVPRNLLGLADRLIWQSPDGVYQFGTDNE